MYDTSKLNIGDVIKNYVVLCQILNTKYCSGRQKVYQLEDFKRYFNWENNGRNFVITEIYDTPIPKKKKQNNLGHYRRKDNYNYNVDYIDNTKTGVYKIQLGSKVYIGSTIRGFRERFNQHVRSGLPHTKALLDAGGVFEILWIANNNEPEKFVRHMEQYYINEYCDNGFELINEELNVKIKGERKVYKYKPKKNKYKSIKLLEKDFDNALSILQENGISIHIK